MFILEVAMLLAGIYALVTGKVKLTKKIAAQGAAARLAGLVMMLPWPLSYCIGFAYGTYLVSRGQPIDRSNLLMVGTLIDLGCTAGCLAVAAVITLLGAQEEEEDTPALRRRYQKWADRSSGEGRKRPRVQTDEWGGEETPSRRPSAEKSDASQDEGDVDWEDVEATPSGKKPAVKSGPEPEEGIQAEPRPRQPILDVLPVEESVPESRRRRKSSDRGRPQARDSSRFWVELGVVAVCVFLLIGGAAFLWWSVRPFLPAQAKVARRPSSFVDPARTQPLPAPVPIQVNPQDRPPIFPRPQNFQPANPFPNPVAQAPMKPLRQGKRFHPSAVPGPKMDGSRFIPVQAQDLVYDPVRGQLYAAVGSTAENRPNTVTALDPATGNVLWSISVGSDPAVLALSDDASVLWVGLAGASAIQRVDLEHRQAGPLLPLKGNSFGSVFAETLAVVPGPSEAVVVSLYSKGVSPRFAGLVVVDRDRVGSATVPGLGSCNRLAYSDDAGTLFAYNNETTESGLRRLAVTEDGVYQQACYLGRFRGNADIIYAGGRIYSTRGEVMDAATTTRAGPLPAQGAITVDVPRQRAYVLDFSVARIATFDTNTFARLSSYSLPAVPTSPASPTMLPLAGAGQGRFRLTRPLLVQVGGTALSYLTEDKVVVVPLKDVEAGNSPAQGPGPGRLSPVPLSPSAPLASGMANPPSPLVKPRPSPVTLKSSPQATPLLPTLSADQLPKTPINKEAQGIPVLQANRQSPLTTDIRPMARVIALPDNERCVVGGPDNTLDFWNYHTGKRERQVTLPYYSPQPWAVTPDGSRLLVGAQEQVNLSPFVLAWDLNSGKELWRTEAVMGILQEVSLSPDGNRVLIWTHELQPRGSRVEIYDLASGEIKTWFRDEERFLKVEALSWYTDSWQLLLVRRGQFQIQGAVHVSLCDLEKGEEVLYRDLMPSPAPSAPDLYVAVLPHKNCLVIRMGRDLALVDAAKGSVLAGVRMETFPAHVGIVVSKDEQRILCPAEVWYSDKPSVAVVSILNLQTGKEMGRLSGALSFHAVVFTPDGKGVLALTPQLTYWPLPQ